MDRLTTEPRSNLLHDQERILSYRPGGYHPVCLGDTFKNKRYKVVHKLGWGGFSTVWLARDTFLQTWAALKIEKADTLRPFAELVNLQSIRQNCASDHFVRFLDSFVHKGPNGSHQCVVTELLGPSVDRVVADYHAGGERLDAQVILHVTKQLLQAIYSLHEAGYAHGAIGNALLDIIGHPKTAALVHIHDSPISPSMPKQLVCSVGWDEWVDEDEEGIRLIDWGESFEHGREPSRLAQPGQLKAPKTIFTGRFDHRVDRSSGRKNGNV
ncbi:hypothetical protein J3459_010164 [Metarhizium acridum]|nr:hypothetical protein J3459_010164 [Metarhizium acridum]